MRRIDEPPLADALNLQIVLKARSLNPQIHVVIRTFNDDFTKSLHDQ